MRYAQFKRGLKLHLVCEAGESYRGRIVLAGRLSKPLCGRWLGEYRMTIGTPLGDACKDCQRVSRKEQA